MPSPPGPGAHASPWPPQPLQWAQQELGAHHLFQLVCTSPHAHERLAAAWAPKAQDRWTMTHRLKTDPHSQPDHGGLQGCGGRRGCAGGRPAAGTQCCPAPPGWGPSHPSPPSGTLGLRWDRILKRGCELPENVKRGAEWESPQARQGECDWGLSKGTLAFPSLWLKAAGKSFLKSNLCVSSCIFQGHLVHLIWYTSRQVHNQMFQPHIFIPCVQGMTGKKRG